MRNDNKNQSAHDGVRRPLGLDNETNIVNVFDVKINNKGEVWFLGQHLNPVGTDTITDPNQENGRRVVDTGHLPNFIAFKPEDQEQVLRRLLVEAQIKKDETNPSKQTIIKKYAQSSSIDEAKAAEAIALQEIKAKYKLDNNRTLVDALSKDEKLLELAEYSQISNASQAERIASGMSNAGLFGDDGSGVLVAIAKESTFKRELILDEYGNPKAVSSAAIVGDITSINKNRVVGLATALNTFVGAEIRQEYKDNKVENKLYPKGYTFVPSDRTATSLNNIKSRSVDDFQDIIERKLSNQIQRLTEDEPAFGRRSVPTIVMGWSDMENKPESTPDKEAIIPLVPAYLKDLVSENSEERAKAQLAYLETISVDPSEVASIKDFNEQIKINSDTNTTMSIDLIVRINKMLKDTTHQRKLDTPQAKFAKTNLEDMDKRRDAVIALQKPLIQRGLLQLEDIPEVDRGKGIKEVYPETLNSEKSTFSVMSGEGLHHSYKMNKAAQNVLYHESTENIVRVVSTHGRNWQKIADSFGSNYKEESNKTGLTATSSASVINYATKSMLGHSGAITRMSHMFFAAERGVVDYASKTSWGEIDNPQLPNGIHTRNVRASLPKSGSNQILFSSQAIAIKGGNNGVIFDVPAGSKYNPDAQATLVILNNSVKETGLSFYNKNIKDIPLEQRVPALNDLKNRVFQDPESHGKISEEIRKNMKITYSGPNANRSASNDAGSSKRYFRSYESVPELEEELSKTHPEFQEAVRHHGGLANLTNQIANSLYTIREAGFNPNSPEHQAFLEAGVDSTPMFKRVGNQMKYAHSDNIYNQNIEELAALAVIDMMKRSSDDLSKGKSFGKGIGAMLKVGDAMPSDSRNDYEKKPVVAMWTLNAKGNLYGELGVGFASKERYKQKGVNFSTSTFIKSEEQPGVMTGLGQIPGTNISSLNINGSIAGDERRQAFSQLLVETHKNFDNKRSIIKGSGVQYEKGTDEFVERISEIVKENNFENRADEEAAERARKTTLAKVKNSDQMVDFVAEVYNENLMGKGGDNIITGSEFNAALKSTAESMDAEMTSFKNERGINVYGAVKKTEDGQIIPIAPAVAMYSGSNLANEALLVGNENIGEAIVYLGKVVNEQGELAPGSVEVAHYNAKQKDKTKKTTALVAHENTFFPGAGFNKVEEDALPDDDVTIVIGEGGATVAAAATILDMDEDKMLAAASFGGASKARGFMEQMVRFADAKGINVNFIHARDNDADGRKAASDMKSVIDEYTKSGGTRVKFSSVGVNDLLPNKDFKEKADFDDLLRQTADKGNLRSAEELLEARENLINKVSEDFDMTAEGFEFECTDNKFKEQLVELKANQQVSMKEDLESGNVNRHEMSEEAYLAHLREVKKVNLNWNGNPPGGQVFDQSKKQAELGYQGDQLIEIMKLSKLNPAGVKKYFDNLGKEIGKDPLLDYFLDKINDNPIQVTNDNAKELVPAGARVAGLLTSISLDALRRKGANEIQAQSAVSKIIEKTHEEARKDGNNSLAFDFSIVAMGWIMGSLDASRQSLSSSNAKENYDAVVAVAQRSALNELKSPENEQQRISARNFLEGIDYSNKELNQISKQVEADKEAREEQQFRQENRGFSM